MSENLKDDLSEEQKQENSSKDERKFKEAVSFVASVVGGEDNLIMKKHAPKDQVAEIVADLFFEERKQLAIDAKEGLKNLLKKYAQMEEEVAKKRKELDDLLNSKRKEFTKSVNDWKRKIENGNYADEAYQGALRLALSSAGEKES